MNIEDLLVKLRNFKTLNRKLHSVISLLTNFSDSFNKEQIRKMKQAWSNGIQAHLREDGFSDIIWEINDLDIFFRKMNWHQTLLSHYGNAICLKDF